MLKRFWIDSKKKEQIKKKHKAEFIAFLEKKYGKEYYNKVISESELERDIDEFETYRKEKNSTNIDEKAEKNREKEKEYKEKIIVDKNKKAPGQNCKSKGAFKTN